MAVKQLSKRYQFQTTKKEPKRVLLQGIRFLITPNDTGGIDILEHQSVLIEQGKITQILPASKAHDAIDLKTIGLIYDDSIKGGVVLTPGFINLHAHPPMYLLRSTLTLAESNLDEALAEMAKIEGTMTDEEYYLGALGDLTEEQKSGITTTLSHYAVFDPIEKAARISGQHVINCVSAASNTHPENTPRLVEHYLKRNQTFTLPGIALHYVWKADSATLKKINLMMKKYRRAFFTLHVAETQETVQRCLETYNMRPVAVLEKYRLLGPRTILSHCVHLTKDEILLLKKRRVIVVHLPTSNLLHRSGQFDYKLFHDLEALERVTIGTDSVVSKNRLDLLSEALAMKTMHQQRHIVSYEALFLMATARAGDALNMKIGKIKPGYRANLAFWKLRDRGLMPYDENNPKTLISNMITHGSRLVRDLMIDGRFVISDRQHNLVDESQLILQLQNAHMALRKRQAAAQR